MDYTEIVSELNGELYDRFGETELSFIYVTNGYCEYISFGETIIWNSEDDGRLWIEDENDYEPLIPFVKRNFNEWADKLYSLKF